MIYYKKIPLDYYDIIISKSLDYVEQHEEIYFRKKSATFYPLDTNEFLNHCPEINLAFAKYNLKCTMAACYVMYKNSDNYVHVDDWPHKARINLPLINCKETYTNFYNNVQIEKVLNPSTGLYNNRVINKDYVLVDHVEIDAATVIMTSEAHKVVLTTTNVPRITLTLGFDKDPVFLIHNELEMEI
jgi:hypothetical protein